MLHNRQRGSVEVGLGPPREHIQSFSKESIGDWREVVFCTFHHFMPNLAENKFATEVMIFYALFSLYQLSRVPPMVRFQRLKRVGQSNMNCAFAAFNAVRHTISQKYSQKHFSAQHALIDDVESFSLSKWRVLNACYRCGRSCIMEMSWLLLSFTVFSPPAFFHGDIFMLSDHIFHQRS